MRSTLRGVVTMVRLSFSADPRRSTLLFVTRPVTGIIGSAMPLWIKLITDAVIARDTGATLLYTALFAGSTLFTDVFLQANFELQRRLRERVDIELDRRLIRASTGIPTIEHHERADYLDRMELLRTDRAALSNVVSVLANTLIFAFQVMTTLVLLGATHPLLMLLPLSGVPAVLLTRTSQQIFKRAEEGAAEGRRRALHLFDLATTAGPAKELRVFGAEDGVVRLHQHEWAKVRAHIGPAHVRGAIRVCLGWMSFCLGLVGAIGVVAIDVTRGRATAGDVMLVLGVAAQMYWLLWGVSGTVAAVMQSTRIIRRFQWLVDYATDVRDRHLSRLTDSAPERLVDGIHFERVSFRYAEDAPEVLRDVNLHLPAGATVAIVGRNGAGKTTLVKLLCGYYEPTAGAITVDGVDLQRIPVEAWRARLSGAFQDFVRFELTLREAVALGDLTREPDDNNIADALQRASATDLTSRLVEGIDAQLGSGVHGGTDLSGGQWQKVAVARAMMRRTPLLLVLDEPTAALDPETEHALFERYSQAALDARAESGAITLIVSHRFSTVRMAELVVVLDGQHVAEVGTHAELMAANGVYATLYALQARSYQ